jgi:dynamin 1-like protein
MQQKKNPPPIMDTLKGNNQNDKPKPPVPTLHQAAALTRDPNQDLIDQTNQGFFGSFFKQKSTTPGQMTQAPNVLRASGTLSEREQMETEVIKLLLLSYFNIVKRTTADLVPKAIMLKLVLASKDDLQRELLCELYKKESIESDLKESEFVVTQRAHCKKMIAAMKKAEEIVANV